MPHSKADIYEVVVTADLPANGPGGAIAACKTVTDILVSGGCEVTPYYAPLQASYALNVSDPKQLAAWSCSAVNGSSSTAIPITAHAYCIAVP